MLQEDPSVLITYIDQRLFFSKLLVCLFFCIVLRQNIHFQLATRKLRFNISIDVTYRGGSRIYKQAVLINCEARRRKPGDRDAELCREDGEIEMSKASRGKWCGEGVFPSPANYRVWGSVV